LPAGEDFFSKEPYPTMEYDFSDIFADYEALTRSVDEVFQRIKAQYPEQVKCTEGCSDCCHAIFDLSLVEAMYVNARFNELFEGLDRDRLHARADEAERKQHKIIRQFHKKRLEEEVASEEALQELARQRVRCPLLTDEHRCEMYAHRPVTCRLYGVPMAIGGQSRTCGKTGFEQGGEYPTVMLEKIQDKLVELSSRIAERVNTKYAGLPTHFVPLGAALMTTYDENYLGRAVLKDPETGMADLPVTDGEGCDPAACDTCAQKSGCSGGPVTWTFGGRGK
jgi:Fe-S-cluster containining protein